MKKLFLKFILSFGIIANLFTATAEAANGKLPLEVNVYHEYSKPNILIFDGCKRDIVREYNFTNYNLVKDLYNTNEKVLESFLADGGTFELQSDTKIKETLYNENEVVGVYTYYKGEHKILLNEDNYKKEEYVVPVIPHELGHYVAHKTNALTEEWEEIYQEEIQKVDLSEYIQGSSSEYFAECFNFIAYDEMIFSLVCPKSYEYIKNCIEQL